MPISSNQFFAELQPLLGSLAPGAQQSTVAWDLYEVLVIALVKRAAEDVGGIAEFLDSNGARANRYLFRSSPGPLANPNQNYTHLEIRFPSQPILEAHTGIWVVGKSMLAHECDCVVMLKDEAESARGSSRSPLWGPVLLHAECKYYAKPIPFWQGRNFLGLAIDLGWKGSVLVMNRAKDSVSQLVSSRRKASAVRLQPGHSGDRSTVLKILRRRFTGYQKTGDV
jgi:hypothetical protein